MKRTPLIITLLLVIIISIFFIFIKSTNKESKADIPTNNKSSCINEICTYNNTSLTFEYAEDWKLQDNYDEYQNIYMYSPDYKESTDGIITLEEGAVIDVIVKDTKYQNIEDYFSSEKLLSDIASNKTETVVDTKKSIQYDYSYESATATDTILIHDGKLYTIKLRYYDEAGKLEHWADYKNFLDSFHLQ